MMSWMNCDHFGKSYERVLIALLRSRKASFLDTCACEFCVRADHMRLILNDWFRLKVDYLVVSRGAILLCRVGIL